MRTLSPCQTFVCKWTNNNVLHMHTFVKRYSFVFVHVAANTQPMFPYAIFLCLAVVCKCVFISFFLFFHFFYLFLVQVTFFILLLLLLLVLLFAFHAASLSWLQHFFLLDCVVFSIHLCLYLCSCIHTHTHTHRRRGREREDGKKNNTL